MGMSPRETGLLSVGQWAAVVRGWKKAHQDKPDAPSDAEFEAAVLRSRGVH